MGTPVWFGCGAGACGAPVPAGGAAALGWVVGGAVDPGPGVWPAVAGPLPVGAEPAGAEPVESDFWETVADALGSAVVATADGEADARCATVLWSFPGQKKN